MTRRAWPGFLLPLLLASTATAEEPSTPAPEAAPTTATPASANTSEQGGSAQSTTSPAASESPAPREAPPAAAPAASSSEAPSAESPSSEARAREAFRRGDHAYLEGDYETAISEFEIAYALSGRIEMLFNLANAYERSGDYAEASVALRGYIPHAPEVDRPALERRLERFEDKAHQQRKAALLPPEEPPPEADKATIRVDRAVGIGLISLGGIGVALGTGFAVSAASARSELDQVCVDGESGRLCPESAESDLERDRTHSIVADVSLIAGTVAAAVGVTLVVMSHSSGERVEVGAGPSSLLLRGTF